MVYARLRRFALYVSGICSVMWLCGCGAKPATLPALDKAAVVLAFGDSLTFGSGAVPEQSYPALLARHIGRKVVNRGVPGEVS